MSQIADTRGRTAQSAVRKRLGAWAHSGEVFPFLLLLPSAAMIGVVVLYPLLQGLYYSFSAGSLLKPGEFVGLANYFRVLTAPDFLNSLRFSAVFALANVAGCYALGLGLALLMNMDMPFRAFFRVALLLPWIVPSVVSIVSWRWMVVDSYAVANQIIHFFGGDTIYFLSSNFWSQVLVILIKIWRSFPFMMLSLLASLQSIDRSLYEAAAIDGATRWQSFLFITLPAVRNVSIVLCLLMTIWSVNDFDTPWLLTQGGPANATENLVLLANRYTFARNDLGGGTAISFITLVILMGLIIWMLRKQKEV